MNQDQQRMLESIREYILSINEKASEKDLALMASYSLHQLNAAIHWTRERDERFLTAVPRYVPAGKRWYQFWKED